MVRSLCSFSHVSGHVPPYPPRAAVILGGGSSIIHARVALTLSNPTHPPRPTGRHRAALRRPVCVVPRVTSPHTRARPLYLAAHRFFVRIMTAFNPAIQRTKREVGALSISRAIALSLPDRLGPRRARTRVEDGGGCALGARAPPCLRMRRPERGQQTASSYGQYQVS